MFESSDSEGSEKYGIGKGWYLLVSDLVKSCQEIVPDIRFPQIKEKFGVLRVYVAYPYDDNGNTLVTKQDQDRVQAIIFQAEELSSRICELCGDSGSGRDLYGWQVTRCDKCYDEFVANRTKWDNKTKKWETK